MDLNDDWKLSKHEVKITIENTYEVTWIGYISHVTLDFTFCTKRKKCDF